MIIGNGTVGRVEKNEGPETVFVEMSKNPRDVGREENCTPKQRKSERLMCCCKHVLFDCVSTS